MKKLIIILALLWPFLVNGQDYRVIDWKTDVLNVQTINTDTFKFETEIKDYNDPGAITREIGNYFIDFVARCFKIIDSDANTITVVDLEHINLAPQSNKIGRIYQSIVDADSIFKSIGGVDISVLDDLSRWKDVARNNELFGRKIKELDGRDTTGIYHINRQLLDSISPDDTTNWNKYLIETDTANIPDKEKYFWSAEKKWLPITSSVANGASAPLYFTNINSDISGYKKMSYTNDVAISTFSATTSKDTVLVEEFLYDSGLGTSIIDAGVWSIRTFCKVSGAIAVSKIIYEVFVRDDVDSTLFSFYSDEINNTDFQYNDYSFVGNAINLQKTTYRLGIKVYFLTTSAAAITLNFRVGDGETTYANVPLALRHDQLRGKNDNPAYLHVNFQDTALINQLRRDSASFVTYTGNDRDLDMGANSISADNFNGVSIHNLNTVYFMGNSLTANGTYPTKIEELLGNDWICINKEISGNTTTQMAARFQSDVLLDSTCDYVVILGGVNDLIVTSSYANSIKYNLQSMYTAAKNAGIKVVAVTITPFKGASWDEHRQASADSVNQWILNTALDVDYRVDAYSVLEKPENTDSLLSIYDCGDHLHLSQNGYYKLAETIYNNVNWGNINTTIANMSIVNGLKLNQALSTKSNPKFNVLTSNSLIVPNVININTNNDGHVIIGGHTISDAKFEVRGNASPYMIAQISNDVDSSPDSSIFISPNGQLLFSVLNTQLPSTKIHTKQGSAGTFTLANSMNSYIAESNGGGSGMTLISPDNSAGGIKWQSPNSSIYGYAFITSDGYNTGNLTINTYKTGGYIDFNVGELSQMMRINTTGVGIKTITPSERLDVNGNAIADVLKSRVLTGTPPLVVASTTVVDSLNVGLLDGKKASDFQLKSDTLTFDATISDLADSSAALRALANTKAVVSGTDNYIMKKTGANTLGNSSISDNGAFVSTNLPFSSSHSLSAPTHFAGSSFWNSNFFELGYGQTGNRYAAIDLTGDDTYSDYGFRILRYNTGENAPTALFHRGKGDFVISAQDAGRVILGTKNTSALIIDTLQNVGIGVIDTTYELNVVGKVNSTGGFFKNGVEITGGSGSMVYPINSGIVAFNGTTWGTSITNNSSLWNNSYDKKIVSAAFSGTSTKTLTLYQQDGNVLQAAFTDESGGTTNWSKDTYGLYYTAGKVGVGANSDVNTWLNVGSLTSTNIGVYGKSQTNPGVRGLSVDYTGVFGSSTDLYGVYGVSTNGYGGGFDKGINLPSGNLDIQGQTRISQGGFFQPVSSSDASAPNNSIYYSTTQSKLVYKNASGTVNVLY